MSEQDVIKELRKRNMQLQNSTKEVFSDTHCRCCPVRFVKWLGGLWKKSK